MEDMQGAEWMRSKLRNFVSTPGTSTPDIPAWSFDIIYIQSLFSMHAPCRCREAWRFKASEYEAFENRKASSGGYRRSRNPVNEQGHCGGPMGYVVRLGAGVAEAVFFEHAPRSVVVGKAFGEHFAQSQRVE